MIALLAEGDPVTQGIAHPSMCPDFPHCYRCGRGPEESHEGFYGHPGDRYQTGSAYVLAEEGTYNPVTGHYACDECYIAIGMPAGPHGWVAP